jgi:hypothetical protein
MAAMSKALENLALRKQLLQARSALYRLKIRYEADAVHENLSWARAGVLAFRALPVRSTLFDLALYGMARSRLARLLKLAAQILLFARLASIAVALLQKPPVLLPTSREPANDADIDLPFGSQRGLGGVDEK